MTINQTEESLSANKVLLGNFISLSLLQGASYLLPLITLPYLVRVLGPENFGLTVFAASIMMYFIILTDYGFNLSATRNISLCRSDPTRVSEIFSSVMLIKVVILLASFTLLCFMIFFIPFFKKHSLLFIISFGIVVGHVLLPIWLFQGLEKMKLMAALNIFARVIFTISIFIFVDLKSDYVLVPLLTSIGNISAGLISLLLARRMIQSKICWPAIESIRLELRDGLHVFLSGIAVTFYTTSSIVILGTLTSPTVVGYYSAAEKIVNAVHGLYQPIGQAVFPYISRRFNSSFQQGFKTVKLLLMGVGGIMFMISLLIFGLATEIVEVVLGESYLDSIAVLKILAFAPFIVCISNILGVQTMLNLGLKATFSRILITAGTIGICLSFALISVWQEKGAAISVVTIEISVTLFMVLCLWNKIFSTKSN